MPQACLAAAVGHYTKRIWVANTYESRFLNSLGDKFSVEEPEILGVVQAIERFMYYLYCKNFIAITGHQASISAFNAIERTKTRQIRLLKWLDRQIPFNFDFKQLAGTKVGLIDYMWHNPMQ